MKYLAECLHSYTIKQLKVFKFCEIYLKKFIKDHILQDQDHTFIHLKIIHCKGFGTSPLYKLRKDCLFR